MGAFQQGLQLGQNAYGQVMNDYRASEKLALEKEAADRAAEAHRLAMEEGGLRMAGMRRVEDATTNLDNITRLGVQIPGAQAGNMQAEREALMRFERGGDYTAPTGLQPTYRPASERDLNTAQMGLAAAKGDMNAMAALTQARRNLDIGDISSKVMKMPLAELESQASNLNLSGYPLLYTGKDKNGYTFLKTEADGKTPISGSQFKLNEAQLRSMALAHELGAGGFGNEAIAALQAAHKDVGEHVAKWNEAQGKIATSQTQATHLANSDQSQRISANAAATTAAAATKNAETNASLRDAQIKEINDRGANKEKALEILKEWNDLTDDERNGPRGAALEREYNMINVKAGGTVPLQRNGKSGQGSGLLSRGVEQKKNDDGTYTAYDKSTGEAIYNTYNGEPIPLGMDAMTYSAHKKAAQESGVKLVVGENNGRLQLRYQGADGQFYEDAASAKYAKAGATPAQGRGLSKPTRTANPDDLGVVTASVDPQTKQRTYAVTGIRQRFATRQEAEAAAARVGGSEMSRTLNRYGD